MQHAFELRLVNDHVRRMKDMYGVLSAGNKISMLQLTSALPEQFMCDAIEQRMAFARIYSHMLRAKDEADKWEKLVVVARKANESSDSAGDIGKWCDAFEKELS